MTFWNFSEMNVDFEWQEWFQLHGFLLSFFDFLILIFLFIYLAWGNLGKVELEDILKDGEYL